MSTLGQKTTCGLGEGLWDWGGSVGKLRFSGSLKVGLGHCWWGNLIVDSSVPERGKRVPLHPLHRALSAGALSHLGHCPSHCPSHPRRGQGGELCAGSGATRREQGSSTVPGLARTMRCTLSSCLRLLLLPLPNKMSEGVCTSTE